MKSVRSVDRNTLTDSHSGILRGTPVSRGFGKGAAYYLRKRIGFSDIGFGKAIDIDREISRIEEAFAKSENQIQHLCNHIECRLSPDDEAILNAYLLTLRDGGLKTKIQASIQQGHTAEFALKEVILDYVGIFSKIEDPYLRERGTEIEIIGEEILSNLLGFSHDDVKRFADDTILIASDISPTDLIRYRQGRLKGIILSRGGETSHVTILAKSFEIPMVIHAGGVLSQVSEKDLVIVDGTSGLIFHKPSVKIIEEYERLAREKAHQNEIYETLRTLPAETQDGFVIRMGANIGLLSDLSLTDKYGADHIGLYRTEFPFLARVRFPDWEEQTHLYTRIVAGAGGREVTIRTLDIGGDKFLSYMDKPREDNPYLGWRSIRVSLELRDMFRDQLRAILKASLKGPVRIMFPMISSVQELRMCLEILEEEKASMRRRGESFAESIPVGLMVEVPGTVIILEKFLKYADFVSVGTNDLVQYTLAVDRNNPKVAALYDPFHPAIISMIASIAATCQRLNKPLSICGEAAADMACAYLFMGMGIQDISMNAASIPRLKHFIRQKSFANAQKDLAVILTLEDPGDIKKYLDNIPNFRI